MTTAVDPSSVTTTYGYDRAGNRTSVQVGGGTAVTTTYDSASLPTSSSDGLTFTYDAMGTLTTVDKSGGSTGDQCFAYDAFGLLASFKANSTTGCGQGTGDVQYSHDALGRTVSRVGATTTTSNFILDGEDLARTRSLLFPRRALRRHQLPVEHEPVRVREGSPVTLDDVTGMWPGCGPSGRSRQVAIKVKVKACTYRDSLDDPYVHAKGLVWFNHGSKYVAAWSLEMWVHKNNALQASRYQAWCNSDYFAIAGRYTRPVESCKYVDAIPLVGDKNVDGQVFNDPIMQDGVPTGNQWYTQAKACWWKGNYSFKFKQRCTAVVQSDVIISGTN